MDFVTKYGEQTSGVLHGFDRIIFRGHLTSFFTDKGMYYYLSQLQVPLTGYKKFMSGQTEDFKKHIEEMARQNGLTIQYVNNAKASKDQLAKSALAKAAYKQGLIAILSCLEISYTFNLRGNYQKKELEIRTERGQHLHYYLYYMDPEFGWMHVRIQSWYPFTMQVYVNGREHLKRALEKSGVAYEAYANGLSWVADMDKAQELADSLVAKKWDRFLNTFAQRLNPFLHQIGAVFGRTYKWSLYQCEYATDVLFKERNVLEALYPCFIQQAIQFKGGEDIYTFFGRNLHHLSTKEVTGNSKRFTQGFRVKHYLDRNSIKMYDKHTILRVETTINNPRSFKIYKDVQRKGKQTKAWVPMGKAVSNLYRYAQIARRANTKYLDSLTDAKPKGNLDKKIERVSQKTSITTGNDKQRNFSALNLLSEETSLILEAINDGRFAIQPFSNKQLRSLLTRKKVFHLDPSDPTAEKKLSAKVTRLIAKLRAHKLIRKISRSFKYTLTKLGQIICLKILNFKKLQLAAC